MRRKHSAWLPAMLGQGGAQRVSLLGYNKYCRNRHCKGPGQCIWLMVEKGINKQTKCGENGLRANVYRESSQADQANVRSLSGGPYADASGYMRGGQAAASVAFNCVVSHDTYAVPCALLDRTLPHAIQATEHTYRAGAYLRQHDMRRNDVG